MCSSASERPSRPVGSIAAWSVSIASLSVSISQLDGVAGLAGPAQLGDLGGRLAAEGGDLLDQEPGVVQLGPAELPEAVAERLELEAEQAAGAERVLEDRAVLELERLVQQLDRFRRRPASPLARAPSQLARNRRAETARYSAPTSAAAIAASSSERSK